MDEKEFKETEAKYEELKEKHRNSEISTEQMKEELKRLMVQDEDGTYWMLGGKTGKWYKHDGTQWRESDPFEEIAAAVEVLTEPIVEEEVPAAREPVSSDEEVFSAVEQEPVSSEGELFSADEKEAVSPGAGELIPSDEREPASPEGEFFSSGEVEVKSDADGDEDGVLLLDTKKYATPAGEVQEEKVEEKEEKYEGYDEKAFVVDIDAGDKVDTGDYIRCSVCESDNPVTSEVCIFCGANLKEVEQKEIKSIEDTAKTKTHKRKKEKVKERKKKREKEEPGEEEELLVKSIKYTSFIFFLGGLGLFVGVLFGAAFGVFKPFLLKWSYELPLMLQEVRGGAAGGLIFAAVGGIGGFIVSAILSVILGAIYNFIAFIFGGIRFKVKR